MANEITEHQSYLLVIPHPDDEVNCCALLSRILQQGKELQVVLITNGDAGENAELRVNEMQRSLSRIGLPQSNFHTLEVSEKVFLDSFPQVLTQLEDVIRRVNPDCLLSLDFDGGHEGHDASNFLAHIALKRSSSTAKHIVYPDYHSRNQIRHGLEFSPGRNPDYVINLTEEEKDLKTALLEAHAGQIGTYLRMQKTQPNYFELLFSREIYRDFPQDFNYLERPSYEIGYEYHRNGFKFEDFKAAASRVVDG